MLTEFHNTDPTSIQKFQRVTAIKTVDYTYAIYSAKDFNFMFSASGVKCNTSLFPSTERPVSPGEGSKHL
jgi:hypothetical protein